MIDVGKKTFREAMHAEMAAVKSINGRIQQSDIERAFADLTLQQDLGLIVGDPKIDHEIDDATRDRLIIHARQDAALNYAAIVSIRKSISGLRNIVWVNVAISAALLLVIVFH